MPVTNSKFSNFTDGGELVADDIVVGLRDGINTRFNFPGSVIVNSDGNIVIGGTFAVVMHFTANTTVTFPTGGTLATTTQIVTPINVTADTQMTSGHAYIVNGGALVALGLPLTAALGDEIRIIGNNASFWIVVQNAGNFINVGSHTSTTGVTGTVSATQKSDCMTIRCVSANGLEWTAESTMGNLTVN